MPPEVARTALLATHGGLSVARWAVMGQIAPLALYRRGCAFGHHSLVTVLTRCGLSLPVSLLADEQPRRGLADQGSLPTMARGRVLGHVGYPAEARARALTQSYQELQRVAVQQEPA